jgi:hypothetical protein
MPKRPGDPRSLADGTRPQAEPRPGREANLSVACAVRGKRVRFVVGFCLPRTGDGPGSATRSEPQLLLRQIHPPSPMGAAAEGTRDCGPLSTSQRFALWIHRAPRRRRGAGRGTIAPAREGEREMKRRLLALTLAVALGAGATATAALASPQPPTNGGNGAGQSGQCTGPNADRPASCQSSR